MCVYSFDFRFVNLHIWQVIENAAFLLPFPAAAQAAFHVIFSVATATAATAHTLIKIHCRISRVLASARESKNKSALDFILARLM